MTTATRSVAVVATRLPSIDRRVLSQAWFSALHLTQAPTPSGARPAARPVSTAPGSARFARSAAASSHPIYGTAVPVRPRSGRPASADLPAGERRGPATDLARRIERALFRHATLRTPVSSTVTISAADGRVQLLIRGDGMATRIVAVCAPHLRERVDRALARARFALAATGTRVEVEP